MRASVVATVLLVASCGGHATPPPVPPAVVVKAAPPPPVPPPPPPTVCLPTSFLSLTPSHVRIEDDAVFYCLGPGSDACFTLDLSTGALALVPFTPPTVAPNLGGEGAPVTLEYASDHLGICTRDGSCKILRPRLARRQTVPLNAAVNPAGTHAVIVVDEKRRRAEVWNVAAGKRTATITYGKGAYQCPTVEFLGDTIFISADVCAGPTAIGALYDRAGKKLGDIGGRNFGTYGAAHAHVTGDQWAFLEESGTTLAIHDVVTGAAVTTLDLTPLWTGAAASGTAGAPAMAHAPGTASLLRRADGQLIVVGVEPAAGDLALISVDGSAPTIVRAPRCAAPATPHDGTVDDL